MRWMRRLCLLALLPCAAHGFFLGGSIIDVPGVAAHLDQLRESIGEWRQMLRLHDMKVEDGAVISDGSMATDAAEHVGGAADREVRQVSEHNLARAEALAPRDACARIGAADAEARIAAGYAASAAPGALKPAADPEEVRDAIAGNRERIAALPLFGGPGVETPNDARTLTILALESMAPAASVEDLSPARHGTAAHLSGALRSESARVLLARVAKRRYLDAITQSGPVHRERQQALQADLASGKVQGMQLFGLRAELKAEALSERVSRYESSLAQEAALAIRLLQAVEGGMRQRPNA